MPMAQVGCALQIGSTTSETNSAVVAGFNDTATGAGGAGICTEIIGGLAAGVPDCADRQCEAAQKHLSHPGHVLVSPFAIDGEA